MRVGFLFFLIFTSICLYADNDFDRDQILRRISPVGQVRVQEVPSSAPSKSEASPAKAEAAKVPGQEIYEQFCQTCHRDGIAGAPKSHVESEWKPRLAQGLPALVATATKGKNAMPPKGTCIDCSDEDLKNAIEFMAITK
jgi:cytochrome c5